jgi:hypothetical protein
VSWTPNRASRIKMTRREKNGSCQITDARQRDDSVRVLRLSNSGMTRNPNRRTIFQPCPQERQTDNRLW